MCGGRLWRGDRRRGADRLAHHARDLEGGDAIDELPLIAGDVSQGTLSGAAATNAAVDVVSHDDAVVRLADGTTLTLAPASRITRRNQAASRWELARGKVALAVAKRRPGEPLQVITDEASVEVVGTHFTVERTGSGDHYCRPTPTGSSARMPSGCWNRCTRSFSFSHRAPSLHSPDMGIRIAPALVVLLAGCAAPPGLDADHLAALSELSPATLPPPPADRSNRVADSAAAAELGQRWFFDPGFSGQLLDSDNVAGNINTLGAKGESGKVACSGCHIPKDGFSDTRSGQGRQISLAAGWGRRRTPSLLDIGQVALLMWDGRRDDLYNQVFGPTESPIEANSSRLYLAEQIFARYRDGYEAVFGPMVPADDPDRFTDPVRFPPLTGQTTGCQITGDILTTTCPGTEHGIPGDGAEYDHMRPADQDAVTEVVVNVGKAIAAYERMLTCGPSRFDAWMHGDATALDAAEQRGAALFVGKAGCVSCHSGPFLSDQQFHNVGLAPHSFQSQFTDTDDRGAAVGLAASIADPLNTRGPWSDAPGQGNSYLPAATPAGMEGAFRTPMLRCLSGRPTFMHTGQLATLRDVVAFFTRGGHATGYPGTSELQPLDLDDAEQADLVAFLESLDGPGPDPHLLAEP